MLRWLTCFTLLPVQSLNTASVRAAGTGKQLDITSKRHMHIRIQEKGVDCVELNALRAIAIWAAMEPTSLSAPCTLDASPLFPCSQVMKPWPGALMWHAAQHGHISSKVCRIHQALHLMTGSMQPALHLMTRQVHARSRTTSWRRADLLQLTCNCEIQDLIYGPWFCCPALLHPFMSAQADRGAGAEDQQQAGSLCPGPPGPGS